ncbi:hypothetical protein Q7P36_009889 [Cladosporium allicinum]
MTGTTDSVRVAVSQHEPAWLDLAKAVQKTCDIIKEASEGGAKIVAFPECWIPGSRPVDFDLGVKYVQNSLRIDSPEFAVIQAAAAEHQIAVSLGFSERDGESVYIAQAMISASGQAAMKRRKMKPTHMERTIFGDATGGQCLAPIVDVPEVGKVGSLNCWEHIQPLLKFYTFSQGEQIHVGAWPPLDPFMDGSPGFYSMSDEGCLTASRAYAMESQTFVLHSSTLLTQAGLELMGTVGSPIMGSPAVGKSAIIGPDGRVLATTKTGEEELLVADLDMSLITKTRTFADAAGHYSRPDMLWLGADNSDRPVVRVVAKQE